MTPIYPTQFLLLINVEVLVAIKALQEFAKAVRIAVDGDESV